MENKKYIASIDIVKYLCAIMIVDSHVRLINIENSFLFDLFRFALYFFECSFGYFYMNNLKRNNNGILIKNVKRLIIPLLFWIVIYTLINLYNNVLAGSQTLTEFVLYQFKSLFINGVGFHLWFMVGLIMDIVVITCLYKNNNYKKMYPISVILFIVGLLGSYYYPIGNKIPLINILINGKYFTTLCRLILHGFPMFMMGAYISDNKEKFTNVPNSKLILLSVITFILSLIEIYCVINYFDIKTNICSLGLCLFTFPLFVLLNNNPLDQYSKIAKALKYISTFMYYSHPLLRTVLASLLMRIFGIELNGLLMSLIVVILCSLTGYVIFKINNKQLNRICS